MSNIESVVGVILAGGLARRMGGGDKCLLPLAGKTLLQRTIDRAQPQVTKLLLSANGNSLRFARTRLPVIPDIYPGNPGPLSGIHAALCWIQDNAPDTQWLASFPSDTPFFPTDLVARLLSSASNHKAQIAVANSNHKIHPLCALWHVSLVEEITQQLQGDNMTPLQDWIKQHHWVETDFTAEHYDPFFNINTPQDLYAAEGFINQVE